MVITGAIDQPYSVRSNDDGTFTIAPIEVHAPPVMPSDQLRAVYVSAAHRVTQPSTITISSSLGAARIVELAGQIAKAEKIPVVVSPLGFSSAIADGIENDFPGVEVIRVTRSERRGASDA